MHPALFVLVIVSGAAVVCAGYEHRQKAFDWWNEWCETRKYKQYVKAMSEKQAAGQHVYQNEEQSDDDDDDDDDDIPLFHSLRDRLQRQSREGLRNRREAHFPLSNQDSLDEDALLEMERLVQARKVELHREELRLAEKELDLERRRVLLKSRGNSIMGITSPQGELFSAFNSFTDESSHHVVPTSPVWAERPGGAHGPSDSEESWDRMERSSLHSRHGIQHERASPY